MRGNNTWSRLIPVPRLAATLAVPYPESVRRSLLLHLYHYHRVPPHVRERAVNNHCHCAGLISVV